MSRISIARQQVGACSLSDPGFLHRVCGGIIGDNVGEVLGTEPSIKQEVGFFNRYRVPTVHLHYCEAHIIGQETLVRCHRGQHVTRKKAQR